MAVGREALGRRHFKTRRITVESWGGEVILRGLSSSEAEIVQEYASKGVDAKKRAVTNSKAISLMGRAAVALGWIDENGNNVLRWPDDSKALADEPTDVIDALSSVVFELSGMKAAAATDVDDEADPVASAEKN